MQNHLPPFLPPSSTDNKASTAEKAPDHLNPQRSAFIERRAALKKVEKLGDNPEDQLTSEEKSSLKWARNYISKQFRPLVADRNCVPRGSVAWLETGSGSI